MSLRALIGAALLFHSALALGKLIVGAAQGTLKNLGRLLAHRGIIGLGDGSSLWADRWLIRGAHHVFQVRAAVLDGPLGHHGI